MKRLYLLGLIALVSLLQQGCVAWRYTTTPVVTGRVIDAETGGPVVDAEVGFRKHESVSTRTKEDGTFSLASDHKWGPAIGIPFEFTLCGGVLYVAAAGYETLEKDVGRRVYHPVDLSEVCLRKRAAIQLPEPPSGPAPGRDSS